MRTSFRALSFAFVALFASLSHGETTYRKTSFTSTEPQPPWADEYKERYAFEKAQYTLNVFAASYHPWTGSRKPRFNEQNPGIGIRRWNEGEFLWGRTYTELNLILRNSQRGDSETIGAGIDWNLIEGEQFRIHAGGQLLWLRYYSGTKKRSASGLVPIVTVSLAWRRHALNTAILPKKIMLFYYSYDL